MARRNTGHHQSRRRLPDHAPPIEVTIDHVGGRGDGVATATLGAGHQSRQRSIFVPNTLPGERVAARATSDGGEGVTCQLTELVLPSDDRVDPACPHFGACGGCSLQHWAETPYRQWKRERVIAAIHRSGLDARHIDGLVTARPGTRRRAEFVIRRLQASAVLGFYERGSNRIVDIDACPVLDPMVTGLADALRDIAPALLDPGETARVMVNLLDSGLDMLLTLPGEPGLAALEALAALAERQDLCRVAARLEKAEPGATTVPLLERRPARINFAGVDVNPPPGVFLQATSDGADAISRAVHAGVGEAERIGDLYAGCGTLSFPLSKVARVHAVEGDAEAAAALSQAAAKAGIAGSLTVETRDLARRPLMPGDLSIFDALVFDPPRAGARAQAEQIALGGPDRLVAVSCNPATFARDARILAKGGYRLDRVTPIDQFLWSPHVELVAHFSRGQPHE